MLAYSVLQYKWQFELYQGYLFRPWRLLMLIYTLPGIVAGLLLRTQFFFFQVQLIILFSFKGLWLIYLPESPKFLLTVRKEDEALEVVKWIYRTNKGKSNDDDLKIAKLLSEASEIVGRNYKGM